MADEADVPEGPDDGPDDDVVATEPDADAVEEASADSGADAKRPWSHVRLALTVGLAAVVALAGLTGWLGYRAYEARQAEQLRQQLVQVGRQGAINLTTIDFQHADADVQRDRDSAAEGLYEDLGERCQLNIEVVKQAQSKSVGTVTEAGLESVNGTEGQVLVAVTVQTSNRGAAEQQPRLWRMRLTVKKVGDDAKVSKVEFVP